MLWSARADTWAHARVTQVAGVSSVWSFEVRATKLAGLAKVDITVRDLLGKLLDLRDRSLCILLKLCLRYILHFDSLIADFLAHDAEIGYWACLNVRASLAFELLWDSMRELLRHATLHWCRLLIPRKWSIPRLLKVIHFLNDQEA